MNNSRNQTITEEKLQNCLNTGKNEKYFDASACKRTLEKISPLLDEISTDSARDQVMGFWQKAAHYMGVIFALDAAMEDGRLQEEPASGTVAAMTDAILQEGKKLEDSLEDPALIKKVKQLFRECGIPVGMKSDIMMHAFSKPRGYAGDYGIIEIVYDNKISSRGIGYCADKRFLNDDYARAVRSRKTMMREMLAGFIKEAPGPSLRILNIACGSCREIKELFEQNTVDASKKIEFTLVDQDQEAIDFSLKALSHSPAHVVYTPLCHSVYDYLKEPDKYRKLLTDQDLVYTIGLADYIPDQRLKDLIAFLFSVVKPGGKLVFAHKDSKNYSPLAPDWWCDWTFHLRDMQETVDLVKSTGMRGYNLSVERETDTNIIFFIIIEKTT